MGYVSKRPNYQSWTEAFLDPACLAKHNKHAEHGYPVILFGDAGSSMHVCLEGSDTDAYIPDRIPSVVGHVGSCTATALQEAAGAKRNSNGIAWHHSNLVAVSSLLSTDYQLE